MFDLGANIGGLSIRFAKKCGPEGMVVCYEPNPASFAQLKEHFELNSLDNGQLLQRGAYKENSKLTLFIPAHDNAGTASLFDKESNAGGEEIEVDLEPVDSRWIELGRPKVSLVKLDIQGAEKYAFEGMQELLGTHKPIIICEISPQEQRYKASELASTLQSHGYTKARYLDGSQEAFISLDKMAAGEFDNKSGDVAVLAGSN